MSEPVNEKRHPAPGTRIAVVGAGALGCALLPRLARLRIETLTIIDGDQVEETNLERQPLYAPSDVGHPKASTARGWLQLVGPAIDVIAVDRFLDAGNANELLHGHQVVADCTDDLHAKELLDRVCGELRIPLVSGSVHRKQGQVIVTHAPGKGERIGRAELFSGKPGSEQDGCDMRQVPEELIETIGQRMASHVRGIVTDQPMTNGAIEMFDHVSGRWTNFDPPSTQ